MIFTTTGVHNSIVKVILQ